MTEQYGFKFVVDANDAAKGWKQFEAAVEGVFNALDKMESHVGKTMDAVGKATRKGKTNIAAFTKTANELGRVKVNASAARNISTLNAAMKGFKAPSAAQVKNLQAFFRALDKAGRGGGPSAGRNIAAISAAMHGFKAPSKTNVNNLRDFFLALNTFRANKGLMNAGGMFASLRQLSGFKAPTASQVKNLQNFLNTVANLRIPRNGAQISRVLEQIARSAGRSNLALRGLRGGMGGMPWGRFNSGARTATVQMMGLQNAMSATYQMGSILRSLFGALTIAELGRSFFEATNRLVTFQSSMQVVSKDAGFAAGQLQFVTDVATDLALDYGKAADAFAKFAISADKAGASTAQARDIFQGFGTAMSVMGLGADKQNDVMLALQQMMNKGYIAGEELNQQLNEHLPGALGYLRVELAKTGNTLEDALKKKMIDATQGLLFLASKYRDEFGPALEEALNRPAAQMNILRTNVTKLFESMAANGGNDAFTSLLKRINAYMRPEDIERYGKALGEFLSKWIGKLTNAIDWLFRNWDKLKGPMAATLKLLGGWAVVSGSLALGRMLVSPIIGAVAAFRNFIPVATQSLLLMRALNAQSLGGLLASVRGMDPATLKMLTNIRGVSGALKTMPKNPFTLMKTGLQSLGTMTEGVGGKFLKLGGVIATGLTVAMWAGREANKEYAHDAYSTTEIVQGFFLTLGDNISSIWGHVTNWMAETFAGWGTYIGNILSKVGNFFKKLAIGITFVMNKTATAIFKAFKSAFEGVVGMIRTVGEAFRLLFTGDFAGAGAKAKEFFTLKPLRESFSENFNGFFDDLGGQFETFEGNVHKGFERISNQMAAYGARARVADAYARARAADVSLDEQIESLYDPEKLLREGAADDDKKGKKGKKGREKKSKIKDPYAELDKLQRMTDQLIRRLGEDNPVLKLQADYMNDLTEQAQALLTNEAYMAFSAKVANANGDVVEIMDELSDAIMGAGADVNVLKDLEARYGVTIDDVNDSLIDSINIYRQKRREAEEAMIPGRLLLKQASEEIRLARMSSEQANILLQVQEEVNKWKGKANEYTQEGIDLLTRELELKEKHIKLLAAEREFYENNGLKQYTAEIQTAGEAVHDLDYNALRSLEDQLVSLGTTGKFSFGAIFDTINEGMIKFAAQGVTEKIGSLLSDGDPNNPSIFGGMFRAMGFDTGFDKNKAMDRINAQTVNLYAGRVNPNGEIETALGGFLNGGSTAGNPGEITVTGVKSPLDVAGEVNKELVGGVQQAGNIIKSDWSQNISGIGGMLTSVFQGIFGNGTKGSGIFNALLSIGGAAAGVPMFKEGGFSNSPVAWTKAPHYAEGTANTSSGGHPAMLHDNEAVIPLSRGRKVPVQLTNDGRNGSGTNITNVWNVQTPNADSFKRSQQQMTGQMHRAASRAAMRNH